MKRLESISFLMTCMLFEYQTQWYCCYCNSPIRNSIIYRPWWWFENQLYFSIFNDTYSISLPSEIFDHVKLTALIFGRFQLKLQIVSKFYKLDIWKQINIRIVVMYMLLKRKWNSLLIYRNMHISKYFKHIVQGLYQSSGGCSY
jgi:hypothetical protein